MKKNFKKTFLAYISGLRKAHAYRTQRPFVHKLVKQKEFAGLTKEETDEIDRYWSRFGIKIPDKSWFTFYYNMTGIKDPRYFPQEIHLYSVLPFYNFRLLTEAYKDKNAFDLFVGKEHFPDTIVKRISGDFYDKDEQFLTGDIQDSRLIDLLLKEKRFIIKNAIDSGRGVNVKKYQVETADDVKAILKKWTAPNYIVQRLVRQHPFFAQFNDTSVNIIRVNSWYHNGEVIISTPVIRFGMPGQATDVCFIDGEEIVHLVGITEDGYIRENVVDIAGNVESVDHFFSNSVVDKKVPAWDEIVKMIQESAKKLRHFHMVGWDITVNDENKPIIIEYNISAPSSLSSQITDGPIWGEHTDQILEFLKDEKNRKKYLPRQYRL